MAGIKEIAENFGGDFFTNYLEECECYDNELEYEFIQELKKKNSTKQISCQSVESYEASDVVIYKGIRLSEEIPEATVDKLSNIMDVQAALLMDEIDFMFPEVILDKKDPERRKQTDKITSLQVLDQR